MALIIPPGYGLATWHFIHSDAVRPWVTTCGVDISEAGGDFEEAASDLSAAITQTDGFLQIMDSNMIYTHFTLKVGSDGGDGPLIEVARGEVGGSGYTSPPINLAVLVRKVTASGGRRARGRFYWAGVVSEANIGELGVIDGAAVTEIQDAANSMYSSMATGVGGSPIPMPPVILHDSEGAGAEPAPTPVTSFVAQSLAATQRRRMRR